MEQHSLGLQQEARGAAHKTFLASGVKGAEALTSLRGKACVRRGIYVCVSVCVYVHACARVCMCLWNAKTAL